MKWININESKPVQDQVVLVVGIECGEDELPLVGGETFGIVCWESEDDSPCYNGAYYSTYFTKIRKWMPLPKID